MSSLYLFFDQTMSHNDAKHSPSTYSCCSTRLFVNLLKGVINTFTGSLRAVSRRWPALEQTCHGLFPGDERVPQHHDDRIASQEHL